MRLASLGFAALLVMVVPACGGGGDDDDTPDAGGGGPDGAAGPDGATTADAGAGATRLITSNYTIPPGSEFYQCQRVTATEDLWVRTITPVSGAGTHHEIFAIDPNKAQPDGVANCGPLDQSWIVLFASGVGSSSLSMPPGVAMKVPAGEQMVLDLHLFNAGDTEIVDAASLDVIAGDPVDAAHEAEVILAGPVTFSIPPGDGQHVNGACRMGGATNFFAVFPHMHKLGKHIKVTARVGGVDQLVYDMAYQFTDQDFASFTPIAMSANDRIEVDCTYNNNTGGDVGFGDSTTDEMCFAISYRYPKLGNGAFGAVCPF